MFARARIFANLTPFERAVMKFIELCFVAGCVSVGTQIPSIAQGLATGQYNLSGAASVAFGAFLTAVVAAIAKYYKSFGDPPMPAAGPKPSPAPSSPASSVP